MPQVVEADVRQPGALEMSNKLLHDCARVGGAVAGIGEDETPALAFPAPAA